MSISVPIKYVVTIRRMDDSVHTFIKLSRWSSDQLRSYIVRTRPNIRYLYIIATLDGILPDNLFRNAELPKVTPPPPVKMTAAKSYAAMHRHRYYMLQKAQHDLYLQRKSLYIHCGDHGELDIPLLAEWALTAKLPPTQRWIVSMIVLYGSSRYAPWNKLIREGAVL